MCVCGIPLRKDCIAVINHLRDHTDNNVAARALCRVASMNNSARLNIWHLMCSWVTFTMTKQSPRIAPLHLAPSDVAAIEAQPGPYAVTPEQALAQLTAIVGADPFGKGMRLHTCRIVGARLSTAVAELNSAREHAAQLEASMGQLITEALAAVSGNVAPKAAKVSK